MADIAGTLGSMFSLIIVTILGYVAARCGFISADIRPKLSGLIFNITLPCTILASVGEIDSSTGVDAITWSVVLGIALFFVMLAGAALASLALRIPRGERGLYLWMGVLTNTGFIGFAVLDSIFGGASVFLGSIFIALSNVFLYSIGVAVLRSGSRAERDAGTGADVGAGGDSAEGARSRRRTIDVRGMLKDMVNVPLVMSLVAMVVFFAQVPVPAPIMQAAEMAGGITSPLAMMLVGLSIADAGPCHGAQAAASLGLYGRALFAGAARGLCSLGAAGAERARPRRLRGDARHAHGVHGRAHRGDLRAGWRAACAGDDCLHAGVVCHRARAHDHHELWVGGGVGA